MFFFSIFYVLQHKIWLKIWNLIILIFGNNKMRVRNCDTVFIKLFLDIFLQEEINLVVIIRSCPCKNLNLHSAVKMFTDSYSRFGIF